MLAKALKTFNGKYGLIRAGTTFNCDPAYFAALEKNKLVERAEGPAAPGPANNRNIPEAPGTAGKGKPGEKVNKPGTTVPPPAAGKALTSSSLRQDLASRTKPLTSSDVGGKKKTGKARVLKPTQAPPAA